MGQFDMSIGSLDSTPQSVYDVYQIHASGHRIHTDTSIQAALLTQYPHHHLATTQCNLIKYATAGHATATLTDDGPPHLRSQTFEPALRRRDDDNPAGKLKTNITFGRYDYLWRDHAYLLYVVDGQNNPMGGCDTRYYLLDKATDDEVIAAVGKNLTTTISQNAHDLILAASIWAEKSHEEVWVFDQGRWSKDKELWQAVQGTRYEDVILDEAVKGAIMRDVIGFFDAKKEYLEFGTPWKRGLIFHGSPGNGKTTTVKALMKTLMARADPIPTLYIKTLAQRGFGPQHSVRQIFVKARQTAPCLLLFEDVDSLVTDEVRSYFLNEMDGLENNDGILMIGSTNNLDKLDPGLSRRPSRFDRKYRFSTPSFEERVRYCEYWSNKLASKPAAATTPAVPEHIASLTDGFSFAYLQEAYIASLLNLIRQSADDTNSPPPSTQPSTENEARDTKEGEKEAEEISKWGRLGNLLQKQVAVLRVEMAEADRSEAEKEAEKKVKDMLKKENAAAAATTKKGIGLVDYQEQLMLLEMQNKARALPS